MFHDKCGIEAHMERHPKLSLQSYSEKHEKTTLQPKAEKTGKESAPERIPEKAQMKMEDSDLLVDKKVKVAPSSPAKSIMSNSSSNPGMIKVKILSCEMTDFSTVFEIPFVFFFEILFRILQFSNLH